MLDWFIAELQRPDTDMTGPVQQLVTVAELVVASRVELGCWAVSITT